MEIELKLRIDGNDVSVQHAASEPAPAVTSSMLTPEWHRTLKTTWTRFDTETDSGRKERLQHWFNGMLEATEILSGIPRAVLYAEVTGEDPETPGVSPQPQDLGVDNTLGSKLYDEGLVIEERSRPLPRGYQRPVQRDEEGNMLPAEWDVPVAGPTEPTVVLDGSKYDETAGGPPDSSEDFFAEDDELQQWMASRSAGKETPASGGDTVDESLTGD